MTFTILCLTVAAVAVIVVAIQWWKKSQRTGTANLGGLLATVQSTPGLPAMGAAAAGLAVLLLSVSWFFPDFVRKYELQGGPTWLLFFLPLGAGVVYALGKGKYGSSIIAPALVLLAVGSGIVYMGIAWFHGDDLSRGANAERQIREQWRAQEQRRVQLPDRTTLTLPHNPTCDSIKKSMKFTKVRTVVNPGGSCDVGFWLDGHRMYVWQAGKTADSDKVLVCDAKLPDPQKLCRPMPVDVESAASAGADFTDFYWLLPYRPKTLFR